MERKAIRSVRSVPAFKIYHEDNFGSAPSTPPFSRHLNSPSVDINKFFSAEEPAHIGASVVIHGDSISIGKGINKPMISTITNHQLAPLLPTESITTARPGPAVSEPINIKMPSSSTDAPNPKVLQVSVDYLKEQVFSPNDDEDGVHRLKSQSLPASPKTSAQKRHTDTANKAIDKKADGLFKKMSSMFIPKKTSAKPSFSIGPVCEENNEDEVTPREPFHKSKKNVTNAELNMWAPGSM